MSRRDVRARRRGAARVALLGLLLLAVAGPPGGGAAEAPPERLTFSGRALAVSRDPATRAPRTVAAVDSALLEVADVANLTRAGAAEAGSRLVARYAELFRLRPDQLVLEKAEKSGDAWYVSYRQAVGGVPVFGSSLGFSIDRDGRIRSLGALLYPDAAAPSAARIGRESALAAAAARLRELDGDAHRLLADSVAILPERTGNVATYRLVSIFNFFLVGAPRPGQATNGYALFVDMATGEIARVRPLVRPLGCCLPADWTPPADGEGAGR